MPARWEFKVEAKALAEQHLEAAAAWYVRLREDVSEDDWRAYAAWLEADSQNREAFDAVLATADVVDQRKDALLAAVTTDTVVPMRSVVQLQPRRRVVGWTAGLAAIAAGVALFVFTHMPPVLETAQTQTWTTAVGETKDVALADGSHLHLNTDTQVAAVLTKGRRDVRLERGEASFDVTHDTARPFVVAVGDRNVRVVGTAFDILRDSGAITVTVARGVVAVSAKGDTADAKRLEIGDQYAAREGDLAYRIAKVDPTKVLAWQEGRLIFEDVPLTEVVSSLNRYFDRKVSIDGAVGDLRFSGILKIDDEPSILRRLESFLPVVAEPQGDQVILKRKSPA